MMSVSIGIPAHNEENNIGVLLCNLSKQKLSDGFSLSEIVVVASGCTDHTEDIVKKAIESDPRVRLIVEKERNGKASAINILLEQCKSEVLVMEPADTLPHDGSLYKLVKPFNDKHVGAVGGRPVPINPENSVIGYIPHVIWDLHHYIAQSEDSADKYFHISGEFCAIRTGIIRRIPTDIVNDDAYIGLQIWKAGYRVVYAPEATATMKGPTNVSDILSQRRRVISGHMQLEKEHDAYITSINSSQIIKILPKVIRLRPKKLLGTIVGVGLEAYSHVLARRDLSNGKAHHKWSMVSSTKTLIAR
ncbi:MAG: glycosyltransferase [Promethearchaeati archaeon SRVP18_Atabeyarchaeia-1]